ncbi:MAG: hypothetical protein EXR98_14175 [Gemmataceae bacterium]|nr:hypothetical protein [Gemmataceae bacterium]
MNALADSRVADYLNENFICTYLKVGTLQIVNGQKQGGNVASYFCVYDGGVLHAVPGQTNANKLLSEARWAYETRKSALTFSTDLVSGERNMNKYMEQVRKSHHERYHAEQNGWSGPRNGRALPPIPATMPRNLGQQVQAHWLLTKGPLAKIDTVYPVVWTQILREQLSGLPVAKR